MPQAARRVSLAGATGKFGIYATGKKDEVRHRGRGRHENLTDEDKAIARTSARPLRAHRGSRLTRPRTLSAQLIREIAFTHLNRLCAYKMMEARDVYVGGQRFREAVSRGMKSQGSSSTWPIIPKTNGGSTPGTRTWPIAISWTGWVARFRRRSASSSAPPTRPTGSIRRSGCWTTCSHLLNSEELKGIWSEDETIGWVYQYFTPKELRDQARKESQAPRNSYELAFRNQFFTPRYVVEFLTDNTLGRIWYEMRKGTPGSRTSAGTWCGDRARSSLLAEE